MTTQEESAATYAARYYKRDAEPPHRIEFKDKGKRYQRTIDRASSSGMGADLIPTVY